MGFPHLRDFEFELALANPSAAILSYYYLLSNMNAHFQFLIIGCRLKQNNLSRLNLVTSSFACGVEAHSSRAVWEFSNGCSHSLEKGHSIDVVTLLEDRFLNSLRKLHGCYARLQCI